MGFVVECATCKQLFEKSTSKYNEAVKLGRTEHYCSRVCAGNRHEKIVEVVCNYCGKIFEAIGKKYRYKTQTLNRCVSFCSRSCSALYRSKKLKEKAKIQQTKECIICGKEKLIMEFPKRGYTTRGECFDCTASLKQQWIRNGGWVSKRQSNAKRRAQKRITTIGPISFEEIIQRDKQRCYLCGDHIETGDIEFDHVIPLSRGGPHIKENIKVTHSWCNQKKRDKYVSELEWTVC